MADPEAGSAADPAAESAGNAAGGPTAPQTPLAALSWRVPAWQTAVLFLVVCACAVVALYLHPSSPVLTAAAILGLAALALGVAGLRMYLVVDDEGVEVRHILRESWLPWAEIARVEIVSGVRGADTIRFSTPGGPPVDVPPSLLQPSKPLSKPRALGRLKGILGEIEARRPRHSPSSG